MLTVDVDDTGPIVGAHTTRAHLPPEKRDKWSPSCDSGRKIPVSVKYVLAATVHNVHFGNYDGPVVKMALYMLQGHIM